MIRQIETALEELELDYNSYDNYVKLRCPFAKKTHEGGTDNSPSFSINPSKNLAGCYSCGIKFEVSEFFVEYGKYANKQIDFDFFEIYRPAIIKREEKNYVLDEDILDSFILNDPKISEYLLTRDIISDNIDIPLYYDPRSDRVVVAVRNSKAQLVGATSRSIQKWMVKSHHYFRFLTSIELLGHQQRQYDRSILVEGLTDYLSAKDKVNRLGLEYDVYGLLGAKFSDKQAYDLSELDQSVMIALDLDKPGRAARKKVKRKCSNLLLKEVFWQDSRRDLSDLTVKEFSEIFG